MSPDQDESMPIPQDYESTTFTVDTPPETGTGFLDEKDEHITKPNRFLVPWPGDTFIIRSDDQVLTLLDGQIVLSDPGRRGSVDWFCVENNGWLGFRNVVSGKFLGHDGKGKICCSADKHQGWEHFCVRMKPEGGCVLFMKNWHDLWHVGMREEDGVKKLAKIKSGDDAMVWEFFKVSHTQTC